MLTLHLDRRRWDGFCLMQVSSQGFEPGGDDARYRDCVIVVEQTGRRTRQHQSEVSGKVFQLPRCECGAGASLNGSSMGGCGYMLCLLLRAVCVGVFRLLLLAWRQWRRPCFSYSGGL